MSAIADNLRMDTHWRQRLTAALEAKKISMRKASLDAGFAAGYVHSILGPDQKDPGIASLMAICDAAGISVMHVLFGFDLTPEDEKIVAAMHESPERREAVIVLIGEQDPASE